MNNIHCKICFHPTSILFKTLVLNKHQVSYYRCSNCDFIQTEDPHWLSEAYGNAITDLDTGLVQRNIDYSGLIGNILVGSFDSKKKFLDYAGGYGLFVRLMRDKGFDFYWEDKYCENIFAQNYELQETKNPFEAVTALEVFEHLTNPLSEIEKMFFYSDTILFSTELQPDKEIHSPNDWWYFAPETGQHIAFYSQKTLECIAEKIGCDLFTNGSTFHTLTKRKFSRNPLEISENQSMPMQSLTQSDFEFAKDVIKKNKEMKGDQGGQLVRDWEKDLIISLARNDFLENKVFLFQEKLAQTENALFSTQEKLSQTENTLVETQEKFTQTENARALTQTELNSIRTSREWKFALFVQKTVKKLFPNGSARRRAGVFLFQKIKKVIKTVFMVKGGVVKSFLTVKGFLKSFQPRKKREINQSSRKIVFIGHSYHNKTKSSRFLLDYLEEFYEVKIIWDESWEGMPYPDLSFIDKSYLGVIFWQLLPDVSIVQKIRNENIIFFPMYDQSGRLDFSYWEKYGDLKIVSFSRTLYANLKKWGMDVLYAQYFPKPSEYIPGNKKEIFFWQRLTNINVNTIFSLLKKEETGIKIHIHKALDPPDHVFVAPSKEKERQYAITCSDWFPTKEEMWEVIKQKGVYIAPREYEGIGMSFLEAMAMGKAVIAVDNPTMNEYIEHGKTGYLFDLKNPQAIDFSHIEEVQKQTHAFMKEGYEKWKKEKHIITEFIERA